MSKLRGIQTVLGSVHIVLSIIAISEKYLSHFDSDWRPDISTIRKKLKEYVSLGILTAEKQGRELYYGLSEDNVSLTAWDDTAAFFSEMDPLGVIGSTILDKLDAVPDHFQFKHHYPSSRIVVKMRKWSPTSSFFRQLITHIPQKVSPGITKIQLVFYTQRHFDSASG